MRISKYLVAAFAAGSSILAMANTQFTGGVLIMNEEMSGNPTNGSINFFDPQGEGSWNYRVFRQANSGKEIPGAICHAHIYADKLIIISNHPAESGSYDMAGTLTVVDAATLQLLKSVELVNRHGKPVQGRCAISAGYGSNYIGEHTVLVTTTDGILIYSVSDDKLESDPGFEIAISPDGVASSTPYQYPYQTGTMVQIGNTVFAASQSYGLVRIPLFETADKADCLSVADMFPDGLPDGLSDNNGIGSVAVSADGNLWMSVTSDRDASGNAAPVLVKYDTETEQFSAVKIPEGIYPPSNSWYAWTPDGFHASPTENVLYWNGGPNSWFSNSAVFKYDIDNDTFSQILDLGEQDANSWKIYGCSMRTSPVSGEIYLSLFKDYSSTDYSLRRISPDGDIIAEHPMATGYWFPSLPVFTDSKAPVMKEFEEMVIPTDRPTKVNLYGAATDPDSPDSQIIYRVTQGDDTSGNGYSLATDWRSVTITPKTATEGTHWVEIVADSQGRTVSGKLRFRFDTAGIDDIASESPKAKAYIQDGYLHLSNETGRMAVASTFTPQGCLVATYEVPSGESIHSLADLPAGIYILRFGSTTIKFSL